MGVSDREGKTVSFYICLPISPLGEGVLSYSVVVIGWGDKRWVFQVRKNSVLIYCTESTGHIKQLSLKQL